MIYQGIYDLINTYIFGGTVVAGSYAELVTMLFATTASIAFVALPLVFVWRVVTRFFGA